MAEEENAAAVRRLYEKFQEKDFEAIVGGMAHDVQWELPEITAAPLFGHRRGQQSVREFFAALTEARDIAVMALDTVVAQGDTVVVLGHFTWRVKVTGRCFTSDFAHAFYLTDGKVERFQEYLDTAAVAAAHQAR